MSNPGQSKKHSLTETFVNIAVGYTVSVIATMFVFPHYGHSVTFREANEITLFFTVLSIVRQYFFRRFFNMITVKQWREKHGY